MPPQAKACANYLNGVLARQDAFKRGYDMAVLLDTHGFLAEGSIESVFMVKRDVLMTPPLGRILASISRQSVLDVARADGIETVERNISLDELYDADEIFTSATPFKVLPVGKFEDIEFDKAPGPVSTRLTRLMNDILAYRDDRFAHWFTLMA